MQTYNFSHLLLQKKNIYIEFVQDIDIFTFATSGKINT